MIPLTEVFADISNQMGWLATYEPKQNASGASQKIFISLIQAPIISEKRQYFAQRFNFAKTRISCCQAVPSRTRGLPPLSMISDQCSIGEHHRKNKFQVKDHVLSTEDNIGHGSHKGGFLCCVRSSSLESRKTRAVIPLADKLTNVPNQRHWLSTTFEDQQATV